MLYCDRSTESSYQICTEVSSVWMQRRQVTSWPTWTGQELWRISALQRISSLQTATARLAWSVFVWVGPCRWHLLLSLTKVRASVRFHRLPRYNMLAPHVAVDLMSAVACLCVGLRCVLQLIVRLPSTASLIHPWPTCLPSKSPCLDTLATRTRWKVFPTAEQQMP